MKSKKEIVYLNKETRGDLCINRDHRIICRNNCNFCGLDDFIEAGGDFNELFFKIGKINFRFGGRISLIAGNIHIEYEFKTFIFNMNVVNGGER